MLYDVLDINEVVIICFEVVLILILNLVLVWSRHFSNHCNHALVSSLSCLLVIADIGVLPSDSQVLFPATVSIQITLVNMVLNGHPLEQVLIIGLKSGYQLVQFFLKIKFLIPLVLILWILVGLHPTRDSLLYLCHGDAVLKRNTCEWAAFILLIGEGVARLL
jgi:hypothetical protein